jgi:hypothetical protein
MPSRRDDLLIFLALVAVVAGTVLLAVLLPAAPAPRPPSAASYGDQNPTCIEWTDACVVCRRDGHDIACSTPGIACVRGAVQCRKRAGS